MKKIQIGTIISFVMLVGIWLIPQHGWSAILVPYEPRNQVDVTVTVDVQFDQTAQLYTYHYHVTNLTTSPQEVSDFAVAVDAEVLNVQSPPGWSSGVIHDEPIITWEATELGPEGDVISETPEIPVIPPSPFQIKQGETLSGFIFQSSALPQNTQFFVRGWAPLPWADDAGELFDAGVPILTFTKESKMEATQGPGIDDSLIFTGGRRPSVDGFLGFVGAENRETRTLPVSIIVRFGVNGEQVDTTTFSAILNRVDVTEAFQLTGNGSEKRAVFELGNSPIVVGRNVLKTSVDGIVPDTTRTASDGDAFTFFVVE